MSQIGTLAVWQVNDSITGHDIHLLMIFGGIIAFSLLAQSLVVAIAALGGVKVQKKVMADVADLKAKALPAIEKVNALTAQFSVITADLTPTVKNIAAKADLIAGHAEHISALVREKAEEFAPTLSAANETVAEANETVREANRKAQEQVARVNGMISSVLDATAQAGESIKRGIKIPGRELGGVVSGIKAALGALSRPKPAVPPLHLHQPYRALTSSYRNPDVLDEGIPGEPLQ